MTHDKKQSNLMNIGHIIIFHKQCISISYKFMYTFKFGLGLYDNASYTKENIK